MSAGHPGISTNPALCAALWRAVARTLAAGLIGGPTIALAAAGYGGGGLGGVCIGGGSPEGSGMGMGPGDSARLVLEPSDIERYPKVDPPWIFPGAPGQGASGGWADARVAHAGTVTLGAGSEIWGDNGGPTQEGLLVGDTMAWGGAGGGGAGLVAAEVDLRVLGTVSGGAGGDTRSAILSNAGGGGTAIVIGKGSLIVENDAIILGGRAPYRRRPSAPRRARSPWAWPGATPLAT